MTGCDREMTLKEVVHEYGQSHLAARQFDEIERLVQESRSTRWFHLWKKIKILLLLEQLFIDMEKIR
jgi:hypothetical protein